MAKLRLQRVSLCALPLFFLGIISPPAPWQEAQASSLGIMVVHVCLPGTAQLSAKAPAFPMLLLPVLPMLLTALPRGF